MHLKQGAIPTLYLLDDQKLEKKTHSSTVIKGFTYST
jgi:hypothetical protein